MARLVVSPEAHGDLVAIIELLTEKAGAPVAQRYRRDLERLMDRISDFPASGASRPSLGDGVRIGVVTPYVLIYQTRDETVRVLRVLDGRRDLPSRVRSP